MVRPEAPSKGVLDAQRKSRAGRDSDWPLRLRGIVLILDALQPLSVFLRFGAVACFDMRYTLCSNA